MSSHAKPSERHIDQLLHSDREIHAPEQQKREARLRDYDSEYKRSVEDPEKFWEEIASQAVPVNDLALSQIPQVGQITIRKDWREQACWKV
jgi:hypothetical protein